jgi:hypothetical protein
VCDVVLKDGRYIFLRALASLIEASSHDCAYLWKVAGAVADQQTCLAASTVANDHQLLRVRRGLCDGGITCVGGAIGADGAITVAFAGSPDRLANRCNGRDGRLGALFAPEVVVVLGRCGGHDEC